MPPANIIELPELHDATGVFRDRADAGRRLAGMLEEFRGSGAWVLGIPAGGMPVAAEVARRLELPLDVLVVSKVLLPWTTEAGYGAVAFDGSVWLNPDYIDYYGLDAATVEAGVSAAKAKVERRLRRFRGDRPFTAVRDRPVILVDDGLAAGSTLRAAVAALKRAGAGRIIVAVPTGHARSVEEIGGLVDRLYCANIRGGLRFAVADAYEQWSDVSEDEVAEILHRHAVG
ncbi:MAG TPA: phosphoribosyltransferase [Chromatiales bacterium]|nr:phosphoribosyltransferase [Chromatiales bacterium]HEX22043.1 phosphoribosyltransferase [Chromatiales bacterium]